MGRIAVIGDVALDKYSIGHSERLSPEGPFPVIADIEPHYRLGMAANVALNCRQLGSEVFLFSVLGLKNHLEASLLKNLVLDNKIDFRHISDDRYTTVKERIIASGHQICRLDTESKEPIVQPYAITFCDRIKNLSPDAIIVSDYNKGVVTRGLMDVLVVECKYIPIIVDPKSNDLKKYSGCSIITPNKKEAETFVGTSIKDNLRGGAEYIRHHGNIDNVIITLAESGVFLLDKYDNNFHYPAEVHEVRNVIGAGDVFIATLSHYLAMGCFIEDATKLANKAAGIAVQKRYPEICFEEMKKVETRV